MMAAPDDPLDSTLLAELARHGAASSAQRQALLGKSQPTLSRLLRAVAQQPLADGAAPLVVLGAQRSARYALAQPILGSAGQQPLLWVDAQGDSSPWGTLTHLGQDRWHLQTSAALAACRGCWRRCGCRAF